MCLDLVALCPLYYFHQKHPWSYLLLGIFTISLTFAIRLTYAFTQDNGRESIHRKVCGFFLLGQWCSSYSPFTIFLITMINLRPSGSNSEHHNNSLDWTLYSSMKMDRVKSDVIATSPWTIFRCQNSFRLFKEAKERDSHRKFIGI
ncbi:hypothetical protein J1N35_043413 [Gossypium stocksii]|uniref:Uncharacterized protein n=1 Tax=Gossypium stocksii TaxID=47602 RepID=A0A9D3U7H0_9ROSI|nr:hypothetical protein J1N35_043413 [Gossypium stocksii]